jgi:hypothetical protein
MIATSAALARAAPAPLLSPDTAHAESSWPSRWS